MKRANNMMDNVVWKLGVNFSFEKDKVVIKNLLDSRSFKIKSITL